MGYLLKEALPNEIEEIFSLYESRIKWMDNNGIKQWNTTDYLNAYPIDYYRKQQKAGNLYILEDCTKGSIAAAVVLLQSDERWLDRADTPAYYIHNLVTSPEVKNAGALLISSAEKLAVLKGKKYMRLDCAADNEFLNGYYEKLGYMPSGKCKDGCYYGSRREKKL